MKRVVLSLLATVAMSMAVQTASAWVETGVLVQVRPHYYNCESGNSYCQQSVDPNDPSQGVGDRVLTNFPDKGVQTGTIVAVGKSDDPGPGGDDSHPIQVDVASDATGVVDHIATSATNGQ